MSDFKVFISYAQQDRDYARKLAEHLTDAGMTVVDPMNDLGAGENWFLEIGKALAEADSMVVIISPDFVDSPWVRSQLQYALGSRNYEQRVVSVILRPTKNIPWILRELPQVEAQKDGRRVASRIVDYLQPAEKA